MLYLNGIAGEFHDIDIMVSDADALEAKKLLENMGTLHQSVYGDRYKTKYFFEFSVDEVEVDLMGGFIITKGGRDYDCSLEATGKAKTVSVLGEAVPLQPVFVWRKNYELMDRASKAEMIDDAVRKGIITENSQKICATACSKPLPCAGYACGGEYLLFKKHTFCIK